MNEPTPDHPDTIFVQLDPKLAIAIRKRLAQAKRTAAFLAASKGDFLESARLYEEAYAIESEKPKPD